MKTIWNMIRFCALCLGVAALALGAAGCVIIPTPPRNTGYARTNLTKLTPQQFMPGQNTRTDVILALGEPDAVSANELELAYRSEKAVAAWFLVVGGGYSADIAGGGINREQFYVFEFDSRGCLRKATRTGKLMADMDFNSGNLAKNRNPGGTVVLHPLPDEGNANDVPPGLAGGRIQADHPHAAWLPDVKGYKSSTAQTAIGVSGRLLLTDAGIAFISDSQFANAEPAFQVALNAVTTVSVDKRFLIQRLVLQTETGEFHSFEIYKSSLRFAMDKQGVQAACDFIQSKIKPIPLQNEIR